MSACLYVHQMCAGTPERPEEDMVSPGTGARGAWEPPCGLGPLQVQPVLLTAGSPPQTQQ